MSDVGHEEVSRMESNITQVRFSRIFQSDKTAAQGSGVLTNAIVSSAEACSTLLRKVATSRDKRDRAAQPSTLICVT